jgi:hypothetical protein
MFRSMLIIFRELLNISKASKNTDVLLITLKFVQKMFVDTIKFVCGSADLLHEMRKL